MNRATRLAAASIVVPTVLFLSAVTAQAFWKTTAGGTGKATAGTWGDTTAPVLTADCPVNGGSYATGNNGSGSWQSAGQCGNAAKVTATDNTAVASVAMKIQKGTLCFTGTSFTAAQCTAAGPAGYPAGYIAASGAGATWSVALTQTRLATAGTGSYSLAAQAKDAAGNTASLSLTFTTT